jgi:hypothetical protein
MLEALAERLRAKGFEVTVTVDEADRRTFAEAEADRVQRAEERAERFGRYAENAAVRSDAAWERGRRIAAGVPLGQPILVGHHSERRARRDQERIETATRTSIDERERARYWAGREQAAAGYERFRRDPARTLRRIEKLIGNPETRQELDLRHQELSEEIAYWQDVIKEAERNGFKVWSKADFRRGDYVLAYGAWWEVLRVNAKSLTIPHLHNRTGKKIVHAADNLHPHRTWRTPYDEVRGRMSAEEMRRKLTSADL